MKKKAVCTISGGLDSAVAAAMMYEDGYDLFFIFFDWGQKTYEKELSCAMALAKHYSADFKIVEVPLLKNMLGISLTKEDTKTTEINEYVPNRNAVLETQAVAYAESIKAEVVVVGSTGGDSICPDNSPEFIKVMQKLVKQGTMLRPMIEIKAPFLKMDKEGVVKKGMKLGVPFELTWSCHNNIDEACGECSNCESRLKAFELNNVKDPIKYE